MCFILLIVSFCSDDNPDVGQLSPSIGSVLSGLAVGQLSIAVKDLTLGLTSRSEVTAPGDASKEIYSLSFPPQVKWLSPRFPRH